MMFKPLDSLAKIIAGQSPESSTYNSTGQGLPFFQGKADFQDMYPTVRMWCTSEKRKLAEPADILISVRAPVGAVNICNQKSIIGRGLAAIRPLSQLDGKFLYYYLKANERQIDALGAGSTFKAITQDTLKKIEVPVLPLGDQIRIAHLLGKVEGLIAQRKKHLQQLDVLLRSVFLEMFGDPVRNEKGWDTQPFSQVGKFTSGGTPSKSRDDFWIGEYPWVSPKDMKVPKIYDSEDHISAKVFDETSLKRIAPGHLLIVVRGMILAHSFPVAINMVDVAINQDMKAIKLKSNLRTAYVFHCLNALKRQILKLITTAGHGTKKFDSDVMVKLLIPVPPPEMQDKFLLIADKIEQTKTRYQQSLADLESLYGVLSQQAFKGELDLSRVPMPGLHSEAEKAVAVEPLHAPAEQDLAIDLPDTDNLLAALESAEVREGVIAQWLEAYRGQLGDTPFSVQHFMTAAQARLAELHPDNDFELSTNDYERIKAWVFKALAAGRLIQAFDDAGNRIELKAPAGNKPA